jgi:secreted PhoX family phosphatase
MTLSSKHLTLKITVASLLATSLLAACGGSGGGNGTAIANKTAVPMVLNKGLWIANGTNVLEYIPSQLTGGTAATPPHLAINSAEFGAPQGVTFDASGNLWVMDPQGMVNGAATPALFEFSAAQLAALATNPKPDPVATITSTALNFPQQSVFDAQGNQWVTDHNNNTVLVFTAAQLAQTGTNNMNPAVAISSADFNGPLGVVFDSAGDLWVANNGGVTGANGATSPVGTTIVEFLAAHLPTPPASGMLTPDLTPDVTLSDDGQGSIQGPWALVFDTKGDLFSSNANTPFTLVEFAQTSLASSGAPVPTVTISPTMDNGNATLNAPNGICFDNVGDLAAMNSAGAFGVSFYTASQLVTGATVPNTFLVGTATTLNAPAGCNFGTLVN